MECLVCGRFIDAGTTCSYECLRDWQAFEQDMEAEPPLSYTDAELEDMARIYAFPRRPEERGIFDWMGEQ